MTFWDSEKSLVAGQPYELHEFRLGDTITYWRYADAPANINYGGNTFEACYIRGGPIEQGANVVKSRAVIKVDWSNAFAWQYTVAAPEGIVHYARHKGHGSDVVAVFHGDVAEVTFRQENRRGQRYAEISVDPSTAAMRRMGLVTRYSRQCAVELYSDLCGVDRESVKASGTLDSVNGSTLTSTTFGTQPNGWWVGGYISVAACTRKIVSHGGNDIVILPAIADVAAGQSFDIYPGCDHLIATCHSKFSNRDNFRGQPNIPDDNVFSQWGFL